MDPGARAGKSNISLEVRRLEVGYIPRTSGYVPRTSGQGEHDLAHLRRMSEQALLNNSNFHTFGIYLEIRRLFLKILLF